MIFVAGADEEDVYQWAVPAGLFNEKGEMVWEPERWEEDAHAQESDTQNAHETIGHERKRTSEVGRSEVDRSV